MEIPFTTYLIVCPLVFLAGLVDAIAGGGGLISLPAYMMAGLPVHFALGTNKFSACMGAAVSMTRYARNGYINWRIGAFCAVCALIGSYIGANLTLLVPERIFKIIMLLLLPFIALYVVKGKSFDTSREPLPEGKTVAVGMAAALVIGCYDGFYGPGTGTFLILVFTGLAHMSLSSANGIAKVINWVTNITSMAVFLTNGRVLLPLGLTAGCFSIAGSYIGTRFFDSRGVKIVRPVMIGVLIIFFIKVILELV